MVASSHRSRSKIEQKLKKGNSQFGAAIPFFPCSDETYYQVVSSH